MENKISATYKIISDSGGNRYKFYCDLSEALVCTTRSYNAPTPEEELLLAWETEGKHNFNRCHSCNRFVIDAMFNPEVCKCVACAPFQESTRFCEKCGAPLPDFASLCPSCKNTEGGDAFDS